LYWVFTNLITGIFHAYVPEYLIYKFEFGALVHEWSNREITLAISLGFLMFTLPFTGATYFQKMPLVKTIFTVSLFVGIYFGIGFLIFEGLNIREYRPVNNRILFMRNEEDAKLAGIWAAILGNIVLLVISYFKVKEKEV